MTQYERYGDYIVNRKEALGMGKFGTVWRGYRIVGDEGGEYLQAVAIKESSYDQQNIQEINTLQILKHPNIIRYIDYKISGESLFMVMELCEGGTLEDLLMRFDDEEDLTDQVVHYYAQIVRGIRCIYDKDILHRDIKPSNILLKDNKVKIADFGTSKLKQGNEMIKTLVGTPLFASPEILELFVGDEQSYTEKSDIWSLGLILYCMYHYQKHPEAPLQRLKDSLPWKGKNAVEVLNNIKNKPLQFNCPKMPEEIKAIITHMLTIDVEKRMSFKEFFEIPMFQTHEVRRQTPTVTGEATMGQSLVALELSESYDCEEYELTLINECTMQPKFLKRETIDFQLLKLIEIRDSEDYEEKEIHDAIRFYDLLREEAENADSKDNYNDLLFELDCQIYQLLYMQRFFLRKVGHSSRGIRKTQNQERNNILPLLFDLEREPDDAAELHIHRQCIAISEKHFAHSHRFNSIRSWLKDLFQQLLDNSNIVMKEKLMMQVISPQEDLLPEVKLALKRKKAVFGDCSEDIVAVMSRMEIYLCYDLVNTLAFEFCWRARGQLKRKPNNRGCDFYEDYKQQRAKISIRQIIKRIELAFSTLIL